MVIFYRYVSVPEGSLDIPYMDPLGLRGFMSEKEK